MLEVKFERLENHRVLRGHRERYSVLSVSSVVDLIYSDGEIKR